MFRPIYFCLLEVCMMEYAPVGKYNLLDNEKIKSIFTV